MDEDIFDFNSQYQELLLEDDENRSVEENKTNLEARENAIDYPSLDLFSIFLECSGDASCSFSDSVFRKDMEVILAHQAFEVPGEIELFDFCFDDGFDNYDLLIQMARTNIQKIQLSLLDSPRQSFYRLRESVTKLLLILRCNYQLLTDKQLKQLRVALGTFDSMANFSLMHMACSNEGNSTSSATYHLLHGTLEWRWIYFTIVYQMDYFKGHIGSEDADNVTEIKLLIYDLITLSISKFHKCNSANLIFTSSFTCSCVREMWLLLFSFIDRLQDHAINFWNIISNAIEDLASAKSLYGKFPTKKILLRSSNTMSLRNVDQFSLWIISGLVKLVRGEHAQLAHDRQSYELYEGLVKNFLKSDQSEESMRVLMMTISEALLYVWQPKIEILMLLWESFQKKINSPFLIAGQSPNFMAVSGSTAASYLEQIKAQQSVPVSKLNPNTTSYSMFIYTLGKMVQKLTKEGQKLQNQRVLGRIYTKFPATKLKQLNEMGIHNILKLFITLSISTNLSDIASKLADTLLQIPLEKTNHQQLIMKGHVAMLILYCENALSKEQYLTKLMAQIGVLVQQQSSSMNVLKVLCESLPLIVDRDDAGLFENGSDLLIDSWIIKFTQNATTAEQDRLYESLTKIIQRIRLAQSSPLSSASNQMTAASQKLFNLLLPHAKQTFGKTDSMWMPMLTANLCLLSLNPNLMTSEAPKFEHLFKTFMEVGSFNLEHSIKFLTVILKNIGDTQKLDSLPIMQNWIRFSVLLGGNNHELRELTKNVINLPEFAQLCLTSQTKPEEFLNSKEPLCTFISDIGKKYGAESSHQEKYQLAERVHAYFCTFEKWSLPILQHQQQQNAPQKNATASSVDEAIMRIYTFIAITFLHCAELIFIRTKSSCFFNVTVSHFILPSSLMMGHAPSRSMIVSIHKVWPLIIEGTSRLNYKSDQHINKVLSDTIVKWAPLLRLSSNSKFVAKPFISISNFKNLDLIEFFWMKLSKHYLALQPGRKVNPHCCMMLTVIEEVMHVVEGDEKRLMSMWRSIVQNIVDMAMLLDDIDPAQKTCLSLIERFTKNKNFATSAAMKEHLVKTLKNATDSNLSYHSALYFRFLTKLSKLVARVVQSLLPYITSQIEKVEQLRGSGRDVKLRSLYDQLTLLCR